MTLAGPPPTCSCATPAVRGIIQRSSLRLPATWLPLRVPVAEPPALAGAAP